jgi:hypothetical protein
MMLQSNARRLRDAPVRCDIAMSGCILHPNPLKMLESRGVAQAVLAALRAMPIPDFKD